jgi:mannose-6-phosphate isomerase
VKRILKLKNEIMPYAWGSHIDLARFLGRCEPSAEPQAELWMGAHPKAPSKVKLQGKWRPLDAVITENAQAVLGEEVYSRYGAYLPFLFKVLAADQPLSIQAHPNQEQARLGYQLENKKKIPLSDFKRNYKDDRHKPECICALTPFWGVCGFRPVSETVPLLSSVWPQARKQDLEIFQQGSDEQQVKAFFRFIMTLPHEELKSLLAHIVCVSETKRRENVIFKWVLLLNRKYPGDVGILSPILLNLICLQPGEAIFLQAGQLHAYFGGLGIEIMANSDNVLRGGLTSKHVDTSELLNILDFNPGKPQLLTEERQSEDAHWRYPSEADEFSLGFLEVQPDKPYQSTQATTCLPEILLCTHGSARISLVADKRVGTRLNKGESALIPYSAGDYVVQGQARVYQAAVNWVHIPAASGKKT